MYIVGYLGCFTTFLTRESLAWTPGKTSRNQVEWTHWPDHMYGNPILIPTLKERFLHAVLEISTSYCSKPSMDFCRHVDFAGPICGHMYMVVLDAYRKFPEVVQWQILLLEQLSLYCVTYSAGTYCPKFLFPIIVHKSLQENLRSFVLKMEFYIVLQQRT